MTMQNKTEFKSDVKNYGFGISQKAIIYDTQEEKYFLLKAKDGYYSENYGPWDLAGGTVNRGEDFEKALGREIKEEAGNIKYEICDLVTSFKIINSDGKEKIFLGTLVKYLGGEVKISEEHLEYKWEKFKDIFESKEYRPWFKEFIQKAQDYIEKEKNLDGWQHCLADFENYKKRQAESQKDFAKFANMDLIMQILPVLDNFHASTDHVPEDQKNNPWVVGIMYIQKQLEQVLKDNGAEEIEAKEGDEFDPAMHEAVKDNSNVSKDNSNASKVIKIIQKGYRMGDRVIRAVRVAVGQKKEH